MHTSTESDLLPDVPIKEMHAGEPEYALLQALDSRDEAEVQRLVDGSPQDVARLMRARSVRACTPLMLAAMGHCSESLAARMLELCPEDAGVTARSGTGKTAADYAEMHSGGSQFALSLRALEREALEGRGIGRCPVCGEAVSARTKMHLLADRCRCGDEANTLVVRFFNSSTSAMLERLTMPHFHPLNDGKKLSKKISQSMAMLEALEGSVGSLADWHIVDLCCGKALTSTLAALRHPGVRVTAVDRLSRRKQPHFAEVGLASVEYARLDVLADDFIENIVQTIEKVGRPTAVLGMHLCGRLSERAIELFQAVPVAQRCVLSPCCLPHAKDAPPALAPLYRSNALDSEQYAAWGLHLKEALASQSGTVVDMVEVQDIMSIKNTVITAAKAASTSSMGATLGIKAVLAAPARLFVTCRFGTDALQQCSGEYLLEECEPDSGGMGNLLWKHINKDLCLSRSDDGLWQVGTCTLEGGELKTCSVQLLRHPEPSRTALPHEMVGSWQKFNVKQKCWRKDGSISVSVCGPASAPPSAACVPTRPVPGEA
eukprot:CAMPEP_0204136068 /NCGR_PEP_ID=MMETSP0361-20130328/16617_1 /ASSEMBLY_ACC=CAM_ASM_000343 /TAXON_ID=268821 /ORGANISM="Scrippsiella Hangoei, Strain SHTV-5" /LENGTH=544 /DNA_ID=CAMNT_0051089529 /DNA_START=212 /DNA_END=1843 /DNA_ORIENTATION=+